MRNIFWFRADLRISDNVGLQKAIEDSESLLAVYILTPETWARHSMAPVKVQFILNNLQILSKHLWERGIPLLIRTTPYFSECSKVFEGLCRQYDIKAIYFNKQYEVDEQKRDAKLIRDFKSNKVKLKEASAIEIYAIDDQLILEPGKILNGQGMPYKVFTPFKKAWLQEASNTAAWKPNDSALATHKIFHPKKERILGEELKPDIIPTELPQFKNSIDLNMWPAGEQAAQNKLEKFIETTIHDYHHQRDFPNLEGTSRLSPYLAVGVISARQCIQAVMRHYECDRLLEILEFEGPSTWVSELIWREFYRLILLHFPRVSKNLPFRAETANIIWNQNANHFKAWCEGQTGFPLVDAAMRQLNQTGWMHNRLRMVVANFFTKVLFLDWHLGERYFMEHLIDGDLAANNGGWQWSASTGTDAAPYFRIFNPILQSERFDAEGHFIRKYCPELAAFDKKTIHDPHQRDKALAKKCQYPEPIIQRDQYKLAVLDAFKRVAGSSL